MVIDGVNVPIPGGWADESVILSWADAASRHSIDELTTPDTPTELHRM